MIFVELQKFVGEVAGAQVWRAALELAGLGRRLYLPISSYPDAELARLFTRLATLTRRPEANLIDAFGEKLARGLLGAHASLLKPDWRTLDLLENVEDTIHATARARDAKAPPPELKCTRVSPSEVEIVYASQRRLCALAKGLARGIASHYGELLRIDEPECMHTGASACRLRCQLVASA